jgi:deoxyxylulose-5-phosphate synthase
MGLLESIHAPKDLRTLDFNQLNKLAQEIREVLIDVVSRNGGHLAPNLGVVELTLALHRTFDSPYDKIIWDVGHQSYVHKLLTGRLDQLRPFVNIMDCPAFLNGLKATMIAFKQGIPVRPFPLLLDLPKHEMSWKRNTILWR